MEGRVPSDIASQIELAWRHIVTMLLVVPALVRPEFRVEVEVIAARA